MRAIEAGHKKVGRWIHVPVKDITTPKDGRICYGPRWWKVTEDGDVLFFDAYTSPQCNVSKAVVERTGKGYDAPPTKAVFLEMAFLPHYCGDYV
jgi:hypothetical protein